MRQRISSVTVDMSVELLHHLVRIDSVNHTSLSDSFSSGSGAIKAMHTHSHKDLGGGVIVIHDIADDSILCYFKSHFNILLFYAKRQLTFIL